MWRFSNVKYSNYLSLSCTENLKRSRKSYHALALVSKLYLLGRTPNRIDALATKLQGTWEGFQFKRLFIDGLSAARVRDYVGQHGVDSRSRAWDILYNLSVFVDFSLVL